MPAAGGEGERLLRTTTLIPDLSPDGRYVSVMTDVGTLEARLCVFDLVERKLLPGAFPLQVLPGTVQIGRSRFMPDGNSIAFVQAGAHGEPVLVKRPVSEWRTGAGASETLFPAATEGIESFTFSPDGKRATVSIVDWISGLTIADGVRGIVPPTRPR